MMIRQATLDDLEVIYKMLREYKAVSPLQAHQYMNEAAVQKGIEVIIEQKRGLILLSEDKGNITGMLMGIFSFNVWDRNIRCMNELAYWVSPEYRGSTAGYRLLAKYKEIGDKLVEIDEIKYFTISKMVNSPDLDYKRFGFEYLEEQWICQPR
jgi:hypothetical protein